VAALVTDSNLYLAVGVAALVVLVWLVVSSPDQHDQQPEQPEPATDQADTAGEQPVGGLVE